MVKFLRDRENQWLALETIFLLLTVWTAVRFCVWVGPFLWWVFNYFWRAAGTLVFWIMVVSGAAWFVKHRYSKWRAQ